MPDIKKVVIVDTREQQNHVAAYMNANNILNIRSKLFVGDYARLDDQSLIIDRKQHLLEVCSNLVQDHERFRAELIRAKEAGIRLIVLVEHGFGIKTLEDVKKWENPRLGKSPRAVSGPKLYAIMVKIKEKYGIEWMFCEKNQTGRIICELLCVVPKK